MGLSNQLTGKEKLIFIGSITGSVTIFKTGSHIR
jgi:hypothetical protein